MKYIGIAQDRLSDDDQHKTRACNTWEEAHRRAEKLCKKYYTADRGYVSVETVA